MKRKNRRIMKLKNLLVLVLAAFLFPSLYAQKENAEKQEIYNQTGYDKFARITPAEIDSNLAQQLQNVLDSAIIEYDIKGLSAALSGNTGQTEHQKPE